MILMGQSTMKQLFGISEECILLPLCSHPNLPKYFIIFTNSTEDEIYAILMWIDDQNFENTTLFMIQRLGDHEAKHSLIKKHSYALVKTIEISSFYPWKTHHC
jgi:hypothetical protein